MSVPIIDAIINAAHSALGITYRWGGNSLATGVDCSGLVQQAFASVGINLPRVSADQARLGTRLTQDQLQPGDLMSWDNSTRNSGADHIAIYIGNGLMIEAPGTGKPIRVVPARFSGASFNRVPQLSDPTILASLKWQPSAAFQGYGQSPQTYTSPSDAGGGAGGGSTTSPGAVATPQEAAPTVTTAPIDSHPFLVDMGNGTTMYGLVFEPSPGVRLLYTTSDPNTVSLAGTGKNWTPVSLGTLGAVTQAGDISELGNIGQEWGSFSAFFGNVLDQVFSPGDPARSDAGVLQVIAEFAGRPDMSPAELENKLKGTDYWKARTDREREYNDLSPAEQQFQIGEWRTRLADEYFQLTGKRVDASDGEIGWYAVEIASGRMGQSKWRAIIQGEALQNPESPYSRQVRDEQEAQRQRGIDIDNRREAVRQLANRWGVRMSDSSLDQWGRDIVENKRSEEDLMSYLRDTSAALYPGKAPEMETSRAADPWLQTYQRVMEKETDLFDPDVQEALTQGIPVYDFEKKLKSKASWLSTKNAQRDFERVAGSAQRLMGFG